MKTFTSPEHFTFTNHFNQSLLKSRITMMNKRKSSWKAVGKYGLFIAAIWVCAAFTKPYREEVKTTLIEKIPVLGEVLEPPVSKLPPLKDFVLEMKSEPSSKTKYVHFKEGKLYWVITPKVTLKDLSMIQREFEKVGCAFIVKQLKLNALGYYISEIKVGTSLPNGGGRSSTDLIKSINKPFDSFGGWLSVKDASCGISAISYDTLFEKVVQKDQHLLDEWLKKHEKEHIKANNSEAYEEQTQNFRRNFHKSPLRVPNGLKEFQQEELQFLAESGARNGVYFKDGNLRLDPFYITAEIFVDEKESDLEQIQQLDVKDISAILISLVYTDSSRKHLTRTVAIFTKNNQQLP